MTRFELHEDFRTAKTEALNLFGLDAESINTATTYHELFATLTPSKRKLALAAVEVYKMYSFRERKEQIFSSNDIYQVMKPCLSDLAVEECWALFLNQACRVIKKVRISVGGISSTAVDIRVVLKEALLSSASAFVLVHNHPSGNIRPSRYDDDLTKQTKQAADLMSIRFIDHLIFSDGAYYSYCDEGKL